MDGDALARTPPSPAEPSLPVADLSPEARRRAALTQKPGLAGISARRALRLRSLVVLRRVWTGVVHDGTIHAGNFAYMVLIALFPFFITGAALFSLLGEANDRTAAVNTVLMAMPPDVANVLSPVAHAVIEARTGGLLWIGGLVGLWTVGGLVETIRDILRRAYGTRLVHAFWRYRLMSTGLIIASVVLILVSIAAQVLIGTVLEAVTALFPKATELTTTLALYRVIPASVLFGALWLLFISLTPRAYSARIYPKWPGALFVTLWWLAVTTVLPKLLRHMFVYDLTYGSLAGVMITLFFFWLIGLGMVVGAELNAALAETPEEQDLVGQADNRARAANAGATAQTQQDE
ncbi:MAG: YihY/virulence factor BrkB family protein [Novosphingobium sp.]|nr:YihY/virulence factor BrkB family protein [Novosphingobium sp.]